MDILVFPTGSAVTREFKDVAGAQVMDGVLRIALKEKPGVVISYPLANVARWDERHTQPASPTRELDDHDFGQEPFGEKIR